MCELRREGHHRVWKLARRTDCHHKSLERPVLCCQDSSVVMCQLVVGGQGETRVSKGCIRTGDGGSIAGMVIDTLWSEQDRDL